MTSDANLKFLATVHEVAADADELIKIYTQTHEILAEHPDAPSEAVELAGKTLQTLMALKIIATGAVEHSVQIEEQLESLVERLTKK